MPIIRINRNDISKLDIINVRNGVTATQVKNTYKPDAFINLALYDMKTKQNIVKLRDNGIDYGYLFSDKGIGIDYINELHWATYDNRLCKDFVAGAPTLVEDGKIAIDWGNKVSTVIQGKAIRSAIGFNDEELIMYSSDNPLSLDQLARYMLDRGCKYAINLDGGGSSHLQFGDSVLAKSERANPSWLLVYMNVKLFTNNSAVSLPVYETTECKKKIGSLDPHETCWCLYENNSFKIVLYNITGTNIQKVGFVMAHN